MSIKEFLTSFVFILLAAAPGRTTFVLMMLASQGKLKNIFVGAAAAFVIQSFISVMLGQVLVLLPQIAVRLVTGILFLFFSFSFWKKSRETFELKMAASEISAKAVFIVVFLAEFGDVSQLAIATTAANSVSKLSVFLLAVIALWIITAVALLTGHNLKRLVKPSLIQKIASLAFLIMGIIFLSKALP